MDYNSQSYNNNTALFAALGGVPPIVSMFSRHGTLSKVSLTPHKIILNHRFQTLFRDQINITLKITEITVETHRHTRGRKMALCFFHRCFPEQVFGMSSSDHCASVVMFVFFKVWQCPVLSGFMSFGFSQNYITVS